MTMATIDQVDIETNKQEALSLFEDCSMAIGALCVVMDKKKQIERFVSLLIAIRDKSAHGEWTPWIEENFAGKLSLRQVQRMIAEYENPKLADDRKLKDRQRSKATDLSLLETPREERVHGQVEVYQPYKQPQLDENAVPVEPRTNTLHRPATRKAKESDRPVPAVVTPEIVEEPNVDPVDYWLSQSDLTDIVNRWMCVVAFDGTKAETAKRLRKLADTFDPPKAGKTPSRAELVAMIPDDWDPELQKAAADWAEYKQARAKGERIQTVRAWELALEKFTSQPSKTVISKVNKAIENSWKGWDHDSADRGNSGNNRITTGRIKPAPVDESKIEYV